MGRYGGRGIRVKARIEGVEEIERALAELGRRTGLSVTYRVLEELGAPIRDDARAFAPVDDGKLRDSIRMIRASAERRRIGQGEFNKIKAEGGTVSEARAALRGKIRQLNGEGPIAEVIIGPNRNPTAHFMEFGTGERFHRDGKSVGHVEAHPYMRPAWDKHKDGLEQKLATRLRQEIEKSAARQAKRRARLAAKG